jgi:hypothetical protein
VLLGLALALVSGPGHQRRLPVQPPRGGACAAGTGSAPAPQLTITAAGLVVIGLTGGGATRPQQSSVAPLISVECGIFAIGAGLLAVSRHRLVLQRAEGLLLGLAAGALFGVSNVAIKYLTHAPGELHGLTGPWTLTALIAGAISFYASARSFSSGRVSR